MQLGRDRGGVGGVGLMAADDGGGLTRRGQRSRALPDF